MKSEPRITAAGVAPAESTPADSVRAPVDRFRNLTRTPRLAIAAVGLVREAAPRTFASAVVLQVMAAVLVGAQLLVLKSLIAGLLRIANATDPSSSSVLPQLGALLGVTLLAGGVTAVLASRQQLLGEIVGRRTTDRIVDVATAVDLARFEDPVFHDQLQRATLAATFRPIEMVNSLMTFLLGTLTSAGVVVALVALQPVLLPLVVLAGVPVLVATLRNSRQAYAFEYAMTAHARERLHLLELLTGREPAKELRVFGATPFLRRRYDALSDERIGRMHAFLRGRLCVLLLATSASALGSAIAIGCLAWLIATNRIDIASATTAAIAMQLLAGRLSAVTGALGKLVESGLFLDDLRMFLELERSAEQRVDDPRSGPRPARRLEHLRVEGLGFAYPGTNRRVLDDVSLEVGPGEVVALVGENGSGKTTLVKLLCQLYAPDSGRMLWDGTDARDLDPQALRSGMTVLFQDFVQYHLTVADNIAIGRSDVPAVAEGIEGAARQAGAHDAITALPRGYDTRLGREFLGGHELSGGQWQRLALARAFYRGAPFLIMDEPTAALDPRAEYRLFEQMRELAAGKSVLLISHRFANVRMADRIYVLERGRVVESGDHQRLIARDGLYADLFRLQASPYGTAV